MKLLLKIIAALIVFQAIVAHAEEEPEARRSGTGPEYLPEHPTGPSQDLTGDEELAAKRAEAGQPKVLPKTPKPFSLAELSQFLGEGESSVILPKGSVLYCPETLAARILKAPHGTLVTWTDFLIAHRSWVCTREVSMEQIRGDAGFTDADRAVFTGGGKVVIATFRGNPVTVLSPPVPASTASSHKP
ncbi:hypothetical protein [Haloferula sp. BvORR071]|uniref:hypothetical protein n=1 Tax=Haloferula sp. BvORR071 TaxID=1396141 RepID=UPI00054FE99A|nr:hypothetical protein [Haloferula sp. BvORR071]